MKALVTGADGFLGRALVAALSASGDRVVAGTRNIARQPSIRSVEWLKMDLSTFEDWQTVLLDVDCVFHLAWSSVPQSASAAPADDAATNIVGTLRLLEGLRNRGGTRFIFASSGGAVYGDPQSTPISEDHPTRPKSAYGAAKLAVEHYLDVFANVHGLDPVSLRISNLFGPEQGFRSQFGAIATFSRRALQDEPVTIFGDGRSVRDYVFVSDVVAALLSASRTSSAARVINIGTGQGRSLRDLICVLEELLGRKVKAIFDVARGFDVTHSVLDVKRADEQLHWRPRVTFEDGVALTLEGIRRRLVGEGG